MEVVKKFASVPLLLCHSGEIHQVLMNLFLNASHACEDKGTLTIKTSTTELKGKPWVVIDIMDNGKGMTREVRKKIFDPFFTTKAVGVGTGLGLSVSFGIIEKHEGTIKVVSEVDKGTVFTISLPLPTGN
jgi:signal transduction histidine kinase